MHRIAAGLIAAVAWAGLAIRLGVSYRASGDLLMALWGMARFFTILTNLVVAITMTAIAAGRRVSPFAQGGVALAIILVGVVYATLLRGLVPLAGAALVADVLMHYVTPVAMTLYWLVFAPKIGLSWRHPVAWSLYPLAYFGYALLRGSVDGRYPYPFMNVGELGLARVVLNAAGIALAFLLAGLLMVAIARSSTRVRPTKALG